MALGKTIECANISETFANRFISNSEAESSSAVGLLFIYNHDGEFHRDFEGLLEKIAESNFAVSRRTRIFLFGPTRISYFLNLTQDYFVFKGRTPALANVEHSFYYPDLINRKASSGRESPVASLEWLLSPWQVIKVGKLCLVYFSLSSPSADDFKYILDYFFRYQLVDTCSEIQFRMIREGSASTDAAAAFEIAKEEYAKAAHPFAVTEFRKRLALFTFQTVPVTVVRYDEIEIGMRNE